MENKLPTSKFENNFIEKTYNTVVTDMSVAFSELVANAWDAGASCIDIILPDAPNQYIIIEDDGFGMTNDEFQNRWMVIAYNRVEHQGDYVEYVSKEKQSLKRLAYGRNGVGRHSLFRFDDEYVVETWKNGTCNTYKIHIDGGQSAFSVIEHKSFPKEGNRIKLIVNAKKRIPTTSDIISTLGYRFLFDPEFKISVNGNEICYQDRMSPVREHTIDIDNDKLKIKIYFIPEGEKSTAMNGITFWSGKRLIGNPSWCINGYKVEDARRKFALKHIIVVNADYLIDDVEYDWSCLRITERVLKAYRAVIEYVRKYQNEYYSSKTSEVRNDVIKNQLDSIESLSIYAQHELKEFFDCYLEQKPDIDTEELNIVISALVQVLKSRNGMSLLSKLVSMDTDKINELNEILGEWSISDIKIVLDEIDSRLSVIDAIQKLSSDPTTDELHVLHPLISRLGGCLV